MIKNIVFKSTVFVLALSLAMTTTACKSKKAVIQTNGQEVVAPLEPSVKAKEIIAKHYSRKYDFKSVLIKADVSYDNGKQTQNVTAEIKINKGKQILVSLRFFGITMAKALITPNSVSYYEKIKGTYFEGDFSLLSTWLGADLDYSKIENLILGESIDDLRKETYVGSINEQLYRLDFKEDGMFKTFFVESDNYMIKKLEIAQDNAEKKIQVEYSNFNSFNDILFPLNVFITGSQQSNKTEIRLEYNSITIDEEFSFPYNVPNGYKRILIN